MSQLKNNIINELQNLLITNSLKAEESSSFLFYFKLFSFLVITVITFGFGLLPLYFSKFRQGHIILNYANPFSGGIFIGIGLFHLLPDASYNFEQYYRTPEGSSSFFYGFPMSYFIAFLSYSFILYLEKVAFSTEEADLKDNNILLLDNDIKKPLIDENNDNKENIDINNEKLFSSIIYKRNKEISKSKKDQAMEIANKIENAKDIENDINIELKIEKENDENIKKENTLTPYILLLALPLHGIFEGIALGVINNNSECIILFIAIIAHKWAESFALGISFYNARIQTKMFIEMLSIFTFFTPVGILIGMYFSKSGLLIEGIMLSISSGTFIYVSTSEVIVEEFSTKGSKHIKFWCYLVGGFLTVLLNILEPAPFTK